MVRADLSVKQEKTTDKDNLSAEEAYFLAYGRRELAFVQTVN